MNINQPEPDRTEDVPWDVMNEAIEDFIKALGQHANEVSEFSCVASRRPLQGVRFVVATRDEENRVTGTEVLEVYAVDPSDG